MNGIWCVCEEPALTLQSEKGISNGSLKTGHGNNFTGERIGNLVSCPHWPNLSSSLWLVIQDVS